MAKNIPKIADRPKERKPNKQLSFDFNFKSLTQNEQFKFVVGVLFMLVAAFMLISFFSHLFTGNADQSEIDAALAHTQKNKKTANPFGLYGAKLSHLLIFELFGWSAFLLIPILFVSGFKMSFKRELIPLENLTWQALFYTFWFSCFFGFFVFMLDAQATLSNVCGGIGYFINQSLYGVIGWASILVIMFVLIVFVVYYYGIDSVSKLSDKLNSQTVLQEADDEEEEVLVEKDIANAKNIQRVRQDLQAPPIIEEELEDLTIDHVDNHDEENIRPYLPPVVTTPTPTTKSPKGEISLTIENVEDIPETIEEEETPIVLDEKDAVNEELLKKFGLYDPMLDLPHYKFPTLDLMKEYDTGKANVSQEELKANSDKIVETLGNYGIGIASIKATIGPTVTLYEIIPDAGVRISKIKNLEDDIALSLAALGIRIIAPIPGKGTIGIEVPNKNREMVPVRMVIGSEKFQKSTADLPIVLGKTISNEIFVTDLAKMPHLLMAGATGQGKSVGLNMILTSLLYKKHPSQLKFVLVDPKKVELTLFNKIERHFLAMLPNSAEAIITDTKKVVHTLNSLCIEMDNRYNLLKDAGCRNLKEYNVKFVNRRLNPEKGHYFMPYIVLVIDELADLMMTAGKEVEQPIARLAQLARAIGIHLVIATQRPSVNVITGTIKANFPARLSFKVTSKIDSRTILDTGGAEQLVGMGDMLLSTGSDIIRLQCAFVDTPEVDDVCDFIGNQQGYDSAYMLPEFEGDNEGGNDKAEFDASNRDPFFDDAARLIVTHQQGSTSLIQRRLKLGYNRAGRLIDQLEAAGIVGVFEGSKAREVLVKDMDALERLLKEL
ncbi:DNA translocase FtsK 4TM domain-containing protein [Arcicella sp. LKC2W]|uniref:FtsK/SpoIIIE family DNA translocase n=1 Tax=Arcicella sp. LKC2W TaxID=2984198 RepID=UPI002B1FFB9F|nr:DNA translocase FtsK 4TM domain-containing protein [Arcicella sp. LKC2W]MEA5459944.1 DNA translocase FtsK 4TM domain-containing protein [Arcicella sp. LKC2W]